MESKSKSFVSEIDNPVLTPEAIREKMERRAKRSADSVERRAKQAINELKVREAEYVELMNDRIEQMKERYFVGRGVDKRVTAAQDSAKVLQKEMAAISARARSNIAGRVERFKEGMATVRIEVDAGVLTSEAACAFIDNVRAHTLREQDRIDNDFADADTGMRRRVNKMEPVF